MATEGPDQPPQQAGKLDRRNVLIGLGGLGAAAGLHSDHPFAAIASPVLPPDLSTCHKPTGLPTGVDTQCCPPYSDTIIDYVLPRFPKLRVRPAAHSISKKDIEKYNKAVQLMRELPSDDPRSFTQQAKVHCAYCNGAYDQVGFDPAVILQVHNSWLFFPFHRWYLYFYERILGKLIGDPTFALPFWNWDHPDGMRMPSYFTDKSSALYDEKRSNAHQPPAIADLNFPQDKVTPPDEQQVQENLSVMYNSMVSGAKIPLLFFGSEYRAGTSGGTSAGSVERVPHTAIHVWSGAEKDREPNGEDLGNFYSAGRDPLFYSHHSNVDRMWNLWKAIEGGKRKDISDPDFLDAAFLFYDEDARPVRVKVRDCLDSKALGYVYERVDLPWLHNKSKSSKTKSKAKSVAMGIGAARAASGKRVALTDFPIKLTNSPVSVVVARPKKARSQKEKEEEEEVLVVEDIGFDHQLAVKFDVYVNDEDAPGPDNAEFAGSFGNVPHKVADGEQHKLALTLGITDLLDEVGADDDDSIVVTLVPKQNYPVTIGNIKIVLVS